MIKISVTFYNVENAKAFRDYCWQVSRIRTTTLCPENLKVCIELVPDGKIVDFIRAEAVSLSYDTWEVRKIC